jgi:hypothetical protein
MNDSRRTQCSLNPAICGKRGMKVHPITKKMESWCRESDKWCHTAPEVKA